MNSERRKGLPRDLEEKIYNSLKPILLKYKKTYLSRDRIGEIVNYTIFMLERDLYKRKD